MPRTYGSLFSGIGGLDLGVEAATGASCAWQVEYDGFCRRILAQHWPRATRSVHDVRDAGRHNLEPVDLIVGGPPCQPVSLAGRRKAREDARWLWPEVARIAGDLGSSLLFMENVPGLLTADHGRAFGEVLGSLASLGFIAAWDCFRASDVGAPHRRERLFVLAYRNGEREPQPYRCGDGERGRALDGGEGRSVADALRAGFERPDAGAERAGIRAARRGGEGAGLADTGVGRREEVRRDPRSVGCAGEDLRGAGGAQAIPARGGSELADARRASSERGEPQRVRGRAVPPVARSGSASVVGVDLVNPNRERRDERDGGSVAARAEHTGPRGGIGGDESRAAVSGVGGMLDGLPRGLDAHRWPAGRGEPQHPWEPPRTASKVANRPARLKALGNAVVRQQASLAWRVLFDRIVRAA